MTAARHIPIADTVHTITIDSTFTPTPGGLIVQQGDTVNFQNNSNSAITIQFVPNPRGNPCREISRSMPTVVADSLRPTTTPPQTMTSM